VNKQRTNRFGKKRNTGHVRGAFAKKNGKYGSSKKKERRKKY